MRFGVLTSGGDAPGMNAALRALTVVATARGHQVVGIVDGYAGLLAEKTTPLEPGVTEGITRLGGTILGSSRCMPMMQPEGRQEARRKLERLEIDALVVIGGNGSLTGAHLLANEGATCRIVGLPASIDNDIGHSGMAIGVDTAVNTIVGLCDRISDTARAHHRVFIVEVMGRNCGFLAMRAGIAAEADAILYGESGLDEDQVVARMRDVLRRVFMPGRSKKRALIVKSEGLPISAARLRERLAEHMAEDAPNVDVRETILGHVVRGGDPSALDRTIAQRLAYAAVLAVEAGVSDAMMSWEPMPAVGRETADPSVRIVPLVDVLAETKRLLDGTSPVIQRRVELLRAVETLLPG